MRRIEFLQRGTAALALTAAPRAAWGTGFTLPLRAPPAFPLATSTAFALPRRGYKSLGANSSVITKAQHCRAEVFARGYGWIPADPADVRKVMLEEPPGHLASNDPEVAAARRTLFGAWEGN
jgi:transglutaminase-like putative cysteine protease